jgi:hypothetical protein
MVVRRLMLRRSTLWLAIAVATICGTAIAQAEPVHVQTDTVNAWVGEDGAVSVETPSSAVKIPPHPPMRPLPLLLPNRLRVWELLKPKLGPTTLQSNCSGSSYSYQSSSSSSTGTSYSHSSVSSSCR